MPLVSIIVPNYNHAPFLRRRLDSIVAQSFRDFEVILLDDASSDDSITILQEYADRMPARLVVNKLNSGNPFKQWNRGAQLARGKYLWIAESDDYAVPEFLERMVSLLDRQPRVGVAYCQSWLVDEKDEVVWSMEVGYIKDLSPDRWAKPFTNDGRNELGRWMILKNAIPNASATLIRKDVFERVGGADEGMKLCGDWSTWVRMLLAADVCFTPEHLNYFRTHTSSVRHRTVETLLFVEESYRIARKISSRVPVDPQAREWTSSSLMLRWFPFLENFSRLDLVQHLKIARSAWLVDPRFSSRFRDQLTENCPKALRRLLSLVVLMMSLRGDASNVAKGGTLFQRIRRVALSGRGA